jgi:hypothetical protein
MNFLDPRLPDRFWSKCVPEPNTGCWLWIGALTSAGYGNIGGKGWNALAHRVSFETLVGPVPSGLVLDHLCRTTNCCNPNHLEAVTFAANVLRGTGAAARNARVTHCPRGHEYNERNTYLRKGLGRRCRVCDRERKH